MKIRFQLVAAYIELTKLTVLTQRNMTLLEPARMVLVKELTADEMLYGSRCIAENVAPESLLIAE